MSEKGQPAEYTGSARFHAAVTGLTTRLTHAGLSVHAAQQQALARMYGLLQAQAAVVSYVEMYWLISNDVGNHVCLFISVEEK